MCGVRITFSMALTGSGSWVLPWPLVPWSRSLVPWSLVPWSLVPWSHGPMVPGPMVPGPWSLVPSGFPSLNAGFPFLNAGFPGCPFLNAGFPFLNAGFPFLNAGFPFLNAGFPFLRIGFAPKIFQDFDRYPPKCLLAITCTIWLRLEFRDRGSACFFSAHLLFFQAKGWIFEPRINLLDPGSTFLAQGPFWGQKWVPKKVIL